MPLILQSLTAVKDYIESYPGIPCFYFRDDNTFIIIAGKVCWKDPIELDETPEANELEIWLVKHEAKKTLGFKNLEEIFS